MLAAQTNLQQAQKVKEFLLRKNLFNPDYFPVKEFGFIYFPMLKKAAVPGAKVANVSFSFPGKERNRTPEEMLLGKLSKPELALLPHSQEQVGKILILEIPETLRKKERIIAEAYLKTNKQIETVVRKDDIHSGDYRLRKVRVLAGRKTKETIHQENGIQLKLHLEKTYFSARLSNERLRIARLVKPGEEILVMFSGAGPYLLVIGRNSPAKHLLGVEINPLAHQYALQNVQLNKLEHKITILEGDVDKILPPIRKRFDRIIMPLPKTSEDFLNIALTKAQKGTMIHFYTFAREPDFLVAGKKIKELCLRYQHPVRILRAVKCGQYSPYTFRVCFDLKVLS